MKYRILGKTGYEVSEIGLGTWSFGGHWGKVTEEDAMAAMQTSADAGVNFFDTADVYGDGISEQLVAKFIKSCGKKIYVATKIGRRLQPHDAAGYTSANLETFVDRSLQNLQVNTLDLVQLHCPPNTVYYQPEVFMAMDGLVTKGKIKHYGVSVEKVEEGLKAMEYPGVSTVQIIYNMFRQRPNELFFREAMVRDIGVIVRVQLASGLLSGKMTADRIFTDDDHRKYNRDGTAFDKGETFAGIDFEIGLKAVEKLKAAFPDNPELAPVALRWILMEEAVSVVIPGAKNAQQAQSNVSAPELPALTGEQMTHVKRIYNSTIRPLVHQRW